MPPKRSAELGSPSTIPQESPTPGAPGPEMRVIPEYLLSWTLVFCFSNTSPEPCRAYTSVGAPRARWGLGSAAKGSWRSWCSGLIVRTSACRGVAVGQPLSLEEAAEVLNLRRRNARQIFATPAFRKLLTAAIADLRSGAHARMVHTMIKIADDPGDDGR